MHKEIMQTSHRQLTKPGINSLLSMLKIKLNIKA